MADGCYNMVKEGVRLFRFPKTLNKEESGRNKLDKREKPPNDSSVSCSHHFKADCFEDKLGLYEQFGLGYRGDEIETECRVY